MSTTKISIKKNSKFDGDETPGVCPVCGDEYIFSLLATAENQIVTNDHYYHEVEKLFGANHYPPSGLCVVNSRRRGEKI